MAEALHKKTHHRRFEGSVVAKSGAKTVRVRVVEHRLHRKYKKQYRVTRDFLVHDENERAALGEKVRFEECRPMSARKRWRVIYEKEGAPV